MSLHLQAYTTNIYMMKIIYRVQWTSISQALSTAPNYRLRQLYIDAQFWPHIILWHFSALPCWTTLNVILLETISFRTRITEIVKVHHNLIKIPAELQPTIYTKLQLQNEWCSIAGAYNIILWYLNMHLLPCMCVQMKHGAQLLLFPCSYFITIPC